MNGFSPGQPSTRSAVRLLVIVALCLMAVPLVLRAAAPGWWSERGVVDANSTANDFAAVNQGQVKHLAKQAMQELEAHLPGGAGEAVHQMVDGWAIPTATTNDFSPVTLGALKALAKPFYAELIRVGYVNDYPWAGKEGLANNYAAANIGQAKNLFSFDLVAPTAANDTNHDGVADWWEQHYFHNLNIDPDADPDGDGLTNRQEFQRGHDPNDFFNGQVPTLTKASVDPQTGNPGGLLPAALAVKVTNAAGGALINAPVTFQVVSGGGQLRINNAASPASQCVVRTDGSGQARAYFVLPGAPNATCLIQARALRGGQVAAAQLAQPFTARSDDGSSSVSYASPFAITHCIETVNPDGSEDLTWTNCPENVNPIPLWSLVDGTWTIVDTVPAGTTFHHFAQP